MELSHFPTVNSPSLGAKAIRVGGGAATVQRAARAVAENRKGKVNPSSSSSSIAQNAIRIIHETTSHESDDLRMNSMGTEWDATDRHEWKK